MSKLLSILLTSILLVGIPVSSQATDDKVLDVNNGLSDNFVNSICQDSKGYIWMTTELGLNRFDGSTFTTFYKGSINGNELNRALRVGDEIYVATQRYGLSIYDCNTNEFSSRTIQDGDLTANDITDVFLDIKNNIWVSYYWEGIDCIDAVDGSRVQYNMSNVPGLGSNHIWTIAGDGKGLLYVGHVDSGLSVINLDNMKAKNYRCDPNSRFSLPSDAVHVITPDNRGGVWVGTERGLAYFVNGNFVRVDQITEPVMCICQMVDNSLWVGLENGGVVIVNTNNGIFSSLNSISTTVLDVNGLSGTTVKDIFQDNFGNIWLATFGSGVYFLSSRDEYVSRWTMDHGELSWRVAWGVTTAADGKMWVGTDGAGIDVIDKGKRVAHYDTKNSSLTDDAILSAFTDSDGNMWFGTFDGGLNFYNVKRGAFEPVKLSDKAVDIRAIYENGDQMLIASNDGLFCIDKYSKKVIMQLNNDMITLRDDLVRAISVDALGNWWVGTFGRGVSVVSPADTSKALAIIGDTSFVSNTIYQIMRDSRDRMWVATGNGLVCFEKGEYHRYRVVDVDGIVAYGVIEANDGEIWVSTNVGISCVDTKKNKIYNFDRRDGIPHGIFHGGSVCKDHEGVLYFGSEQGLAIVQPYLSHWPSVAPQTVITGIKYYESTESGVDKYVSLPASKPVKIDYNNHSFRIEFSVMDYSMSDKVEFAYQLVGLEDDWHVSRDVNHITYRNVPAGEYVFEVKARIRNGEWSENVTRLSVTILPPMWLTWWAKVLYVLAFGGLIYVLFKFRMHQLRLQHNLDLEREKNFRQKQLDDERQRFFTNMTHELRTPLTLILGPLEDLKNNTEIPLREANKIALIHNSGLKLLGLINRILDFRKTELQNKRLYVRHANVGHVIKEIVTSYKELNRNRDLVYKLHIDESVPSSMLFDNDVISTTVNNLLSNAVKYTRSGHIDVNVTTVERADQKCLSIVVSDTGIGIPPSSLARIFDRYYQVEDSAHHTSGTGIGLSLVQNLVKLHGGEISVTSNLGYGSTFKVLIPILDSYPEAVCLDDSTIPVGTSEKADDEEAVDSTPENKRPVMLVVEDNDEILNYVRDSFEQEYEVHTAINGSDGLAKARKYIPDIIISDIMMPEMDGTEMCQMLKGDVATSHIPIILLTAKNSPDDRTEGYQKGADSYLTKPFSASMLHSRVENLIESRKRLVKVINTTPEASKKAELTESISRLDAEFIEKVSSIINDNIESDKIDVNFIGDQMGMSHSTLYRKIKALTGMSANEFIRKIKIRNAEKLLLTGRYTISEVSYMVGINSMAYFRQCFKDEFGLTPSAYIKHIEGSDSSSESETVQ